MGGLQNRCGVDTPEEALELAKLISEAPSLNFIGIQAYHGIDLGCVILSFRSDPATGSYY